MLIKLYAKIMGHVILGNRGFPALNLNLLSGIIFSRDKLKNGMKTRNVLLGAAAGTAAMTLFSYFLSGKKDKGFKEPKILGKMMSSAFPSLEETQAEIAGWMMHVSMGLFFAWLYHRSPDIRKLYPDLPDAVVVGASNGVLGVLLWKLLFSLHPDPP